MQAAWLYAQMVRWNQAPMAGELLLAARAVMSPAIYDSILGWDIERRDDDPLDGVGVFTGPMVDPADVVGRTG
jgi:NitT/TauT family transport system ATP-binding protein